MPRSDPTNFDPVELKVVPSAGQWIIPSDPAELPDDVRAWLDQRVARDRLELPVLPEASAQLLSMTRDEDCRIQDLIDVVQRDPSLTAHLLRLANSPLYAPKYPATTLRQAIARLGFAELRSAAVLIGCQARLFHVPRWEGELSVLFEHCLMTALYASEIARVVRMGEDEAFLAGLLHDLGQAIVLQSLADFEAEAERRLPAAAVAAAALEYHCEAGRRLVLRWGLSPRVADVAAGHHPAPGSVVSTSVAIVHLADVLAYGAPGTLESLASDRMIAPLGLTSDALRQLWEQRRQIAALAAVMR